MLQTIEVDGFRSLIGFSIKLQPGLNVIVGANGTGKSNFISFLDFLGTLIESGLNAAIAVAQGAGSMFSKERFAEGKTELTFRLTGQLAELPEDEATYLPFSEKEFKNLAGSYSYSCTVSYLASVPAVFISAESLTVTANGEDEITFSRITSRDEAEFKTHVKIYPEDHKASRMFFRYLRRAEPKTDIKEYLAARVVPERSLLLYIANETPSLSIVFSDLTRYRSVNIDPSIARRSTPVGSVATLQSNGEGLAGALYQLKNGVSFTMKPKPRQAFCSRKELIIYPLRESKMRQ